MRAREFRHEIIAYGDYDGLIGAEHWEPSCQCDGEDCTYCNPYALETRRYLARQAAAPLTTTIAERFWLN